MKSLVLRIIDAVFAMFRRRSAAVENERVEAVRKDAAIREEVGRMADGEARERLRQKWPRIAILLAVGLGISACGASAPLVTDTACLWVRPILVADADEITDPTARDILAHNESWAARCRKS